jgi:NAD(P)-dependent dehydrogenase (short-subunit alcohol dehydrogenase family)
VGSIVSGEFSNKVAVVTGGSRGIGREIAADLARAGTQTVIVSSSTENLAAGPRRDPLADDYQSVERRRTLAFGMHRQRVDVDLGYFGNALHQPADP